MRRLTEQGLSPEVHEAERTVSRPGPRGERPEQTRERLRVVRVRLPELLDLGQHVDELWWPVSGDGTQVTLHPDLRELNDHWLGRARRLRSLRAQGIRPEGLVELVLAEAPASRGDLRETAPPPARILGPAEDAARPRRSGGPRLPGLLRLGASIVSFVLFLVVLVQILQEWRDVRARGLVEESAAAYAAGVATAGPGPSEARLREVFAGAVPAAAVRERYYKGDVRVAWTVLDPAAGDTEGSAPEFVTCVEMRSVSGEEAYAAAWAASGRASRGWVTRTVKGEGCGPEPLDHGAALQAANDASG